MTDLHCQALDHDFTVEVVDAGVARLLAQVLTDLRTDVPGSHAYSLDGADLRYQGQLIVTGTTPGHAVATLLWHINQEAVRRSSPSMVILHAAGAVKDDIAVMLPAPMEHGKTTTVAGLVDAGFAYITDEAYALDPSTLLVRPFPKALSIDRGSWAVLAHLEPEGKLTPDQWQVPASAIGAVVPRPVRTKLVVFPEYRAGATTRLTALTPGQAVMLLAPSCFEFQVRPTRNLPVLARVAEETWCYRLEIGDLARAVTLIDGLVHDVAAAVSD